MRFLAPILRVWRPWGRSPVLKEIAHEPTTLSKVLPIAARSLKLPEEPIQINDIPATEARAFQEANIPSIVIHSVSYAAITPPGKIEQVRLMRTELDPKVYADTYNLMCVYVLYLDKVYSLAWSKATGGPDRAGTWCARMEALLLLVRSRLPRLPRASQLSSANTTVAASTAAPRASATEPHLQPSPPPAEGTPTNPVFRTTTRLVQVDVVVTDKQGRPIPGLTQADFTVLQDGKPQQVRVFEPHTGGANGEDSTAAANTPKLPPNTYSNHPRCSHNGQLDDRAVRFAEHAHRRSGVLAKTTDRLASHGSQGATYRTLSADQPADDGAGIHR